MVEALFFTFMKISGECWESHYVLLINVMILYELKKRFSSNSNTNSDYWYLQILFSHICNIKVNFIDNLILLIHVVIIFPGIMDTSSAVDFTCTLLTVCQDWGTSYQSYRHVLYMLLYVSHWILDWQDKTIPERQAALVLSVEMVDNLYLVLYCRCLYIRG